MEIFTVRLRELRKEKNLRQEDAAKEIGLVYRSYRRYEQGEVEPQISVLVKIAMYFEVTTDYLLGLSDSRS